ncbi:MAG: extracellular solute-binding protein [Coriobacteriales bacterium]|nr:extracellular solute-binding protein [Coriobacteriales bacterium]
MGAMGATLAMGGLAGCDNGGTKPGDDPSGPDTAPDASLVVDTDLASMTWDQVLAEAQGQEVTFCAWDTDVMVKQWWDYLQGHVKDSYGIDIVYVPDDAANEQKILTDIQTDIDATIDLFWGMGSAMTRYIDEDGLFSNEWLAKLPNYEFLDQKDGRVIFDATQDVDDREAPFQTLNPSLVYSKDLWDSSLAWDASKGEINGLFHDFTELAQWVQKYPGKFTYMDLNGSGSFHAKCFLKAILAELTDDGNGGWEPVYDASDSAVTRREKIDANNKAWFEWLQSGDASEETFYDKAAYVWAYLNELKPNLLQGDAGPLYMADAASMMSYVVSNDLACTFTTCTSISSRVESNPAAYMSSPQVYMLQTSIGMWDYVIITQNSTKKAAALVVANAMLDPEQQARAFEMTGNGYNVSYDKLTSGQKAKFDEVFAGFIEGTSPSAEEIAQSSYSDITGGVNAWLVTGWDRRVNQI